MPKISKRPTVVMPTLQEDKVITAAAKADPDAQPLMPKQLKSMVPMQALRGRMRSPFKFRACGPSLNNSMNRNATPAIEYRIAVKLKGSIYFNAEVIIGNMPPHDNVATIQKKTPSEYLVFMISPVRG